MNIQASVASVRVVGLSAAVPAVGRSFTGVV
jgi:hypothetical protein